ncbi:MAG: NAD(P)/FAD-dependent oxidoreductase, partial [Acidimicrobiales bacterium]|nr:NAD(P)/FAD-dependent oxidoreductase [Acidimicrobiales bacterium]
MRFAIIGAGMSGILASIKLSEAGHDDQVIYEKADRLGGTWRENTYPGIACDVPSHLYSYSFAPNPGWSHQFSPGDEIEGYFEQVADDYGVTPRIRFGEEVTHTEWRDGRWHLETGTGRTDEADVVIAATGVLHHPRMPDVEGLDTFAGPCFHSARWDHDVELAGKRVGVIGTGSTAVQIISAIVDEVGHLDVFQRTPPWIFPVQNTAYTEDELAAFRDHPERLTQLHDTLAELFSGFAAAVTDAESEQNKGIATACVANLESSVADPELRERLRPDYAPACKRLIMSGDYYEAIQKPNAEVVTEGIERVEERGVRTKDGVLHELDVLV